MPTYVYSSECLCLDDLSKELPQFSEIELNLPIEQRDSVWCPKCGATLKRLIRFEGSVWAPTAGGMR